MELLWFLIIWWLATRAIRSLFFFIGWVEFELSHHGGTDMILIWCSLMIVLWRTFWSAMPRATRFVANKLHLQVINLLSDIVTEVARCAGRNYCRYLLSRKVFLICWLILFNSIKVNWLVFFYSDCCQKERFLNPWLRILARVGLKVPCGALRGHTARVIVLDGLDGQASSWELRVGTMQVIKLGVLLKVVQEFVCFVNVNA